jgi:arylsulfatase A-like enzyme
VKPRALLALAALGLACAGDGLPEGRRHVLLITVDTLRWDYLSTAGYDRPTSPFIDTLFAQGLAFRRALTPVPRTTPALASLLTGTYPHTHEVRRLLDRLGPQLPTLASLARARGASTVAVVSNHILGPERGLGRGFDVYDSAPDVRDAAATTQVALERLDAYSPSDDLLVWVHYIDPHVPYSPPPEYAEAFDPGYDGRYRLHFGSAGGTGDFAYPADLGKERSVFRNRLPAEVNAHVRRLYAADIRKTDDAIRTLVESLRERFGADWTIVFSADHGEDLGEKPFFYFDHGDYLYEGSLRVPLAIVLPPFDPLHRAGVVDDWASLIDVTPTLIELLGLQRDDGAPLEGRSLVPALRGKPLPPRPLFAESGMSFYEASVRRRVDFGVRGRFRAVVRGNWKLIFTPGRAGGDAAFELYDLANDPGEQRDRFRPDHPALPELALELETWLRRTKRPEHAPGEADLARLRAFGSRRP